MEKYIADLLYRYNCVTVPKLGAFLTQKKSAYILENSNSFYPPSKELSFNEQVVSNDGLLVSYMAEVEKTSYEEMLQHVESCVDEWKKQLNKGERLLLPNIGDMWLNEEGKLQFQPTQLVNYLTASYGLNSFVSTPVIREVLKEEVVALEERIPFIITPERREETSTSFRPYLKYAAVVLLSLSLGFTGFQFYKNNIGNPQVARQDAKEEVIRNIQEATFFNTRPMELSPLTIEASKKNELKVAVAPIKGQKVHHIVAGAFRIEANASKKVLQLRDKGYNAAYIGVNAHGLHQISYDRFTDAKEALQFLREIKRIESKDAWMLSVK
ncbi:MAG: sporulation protein [Flavobacteriaceae bacterium]|nr:MAG: sporulation protein [Flavobacteriaceae bacterium]